MTERDFIKAEIRFKDSLEQYCADCLNFNVDFRDRVLDCVHDELIENGLEGISLDL